jgi:hypothetical protein
MKKGRKEGRKEEEDGKQDRRNCEDEVHPPTHLEGRKGEGTLASHRKELGLWQPYKKSQPPPLLLGIAKLSCTGSRFLHYCRPQELLFCWSILGVWVLFFFHCM